MAGQLTKQISKQQIKSDHPSRCVFLAQVPHAIQIWHFNKEGNANMTLQQQICLARRLPGKGIKIGSLEEAESVDVKPAMVIGT